MTVSSTTTKHDHGDIAVAAAHRDPGSSDQLPVLVTETASRLRHELRTIYAAKSLNRRQLSTTQKGVARLQRAGMAPTANEFWETTAQPRAHLLACWAKVAVDGELSLLESGLVSNLWLSDQPQPLMAPTEAAATDALVAELVAALPTRKALDDLGRWWLRRLRRSAVIKALPVAAMKTPREAELAVSQVEMQLLDQAPWSHGDRLLSAFELAHSEVGNYSRRRISDVISQLYRQRWFRPG